MEKIITGKQKRNIISTLRHHLEKWIWKPPTREPEWKIEQIGKNKWKMYKQDRGTFIVEKIGMSWEVKQILTNCV